MIGHCILSHGLNSSPKAVKVSALAKVAERLGWTTARPDYSDIDASSDIRDVSRRLERLLDYTKNVEGPLVLVGSSMGAYISALASLKVNTAAVFLMAPPVALPGYPQRLDAANVPMHVVHGWHDEIISASAVVEWCQSRSTALTLVNDGHRLDQHVDWIADEFERFLRALA